MDTVHTDIEILLNNHVENITRNLCLEYNIPLGEVSDKYSNIVIRRKLYMQDNNYICDIILCDTISFVKDLIHVYETMILYNSSLKKVGGRKTNIPEALTEGLYCVLTGSYRVLKVHGRTSSSFDCYNPETKKRIQVKATSVRVDCTSFGPRSEYDVLIFIDFANYPSYKIYDIPLSYFDNLILNKKTGESFKDQQHTGKRPRFSIKETMISPKNIKSIFDGSILELSLPTITKH